MAAEKTKKPTAAEYEKLGRAIESAMINDYIDWLGNTKRQIWQSFVRGIFAGLGGVLGATVVVALLVWILHMLGGIPVVGDFLKYTSSTIQK